MDLVRMPSSPAIIIAVKAKYGLALEVREAPLDAPRLGAGHPRMRIEAERLRAEYAEQHRRLEAGTRRCSCWYRVVEAFSALACLMMPPM